MGEARTREAIAGMESPTRTLVIEDEVVTALKVADRIDAQSRWLACARPCASGLVACNPQSPGGS